PGDGHDALDHTDREVLLLQDGPLLDVELEVRADGAGDAGLGPEIADALELVTQPEPIPVTRVVGVFEGDLAGHDAGADHGGLEARPFLVGEDSHGHRVARGCLVVVEGADGLEGAEDAELAVVFAPRRHRVGVRAHHDGRQALAARPLAEDVPHAIDGDREPRGAHPLDEEIAAAARSRGSPFRPRASTRWSAAAARSSSISTTRWWPGPFQSWRAGYS